jgi:hypothetical protein
MIVTPQNSDSLVKFTTKIILKSYPYLEKCLGYEKILKQEENAFKYDFEGNIDAYREYTIRKVQAYNKIKSSN